MNARQRRLIDDVSREYDLMCGRSWRVACTQGSFDLAKGDGIYRDLKGPEDAQKMRVAVGLLSEANAIEC